MCRLIERISEKYDVRRAGFGCDVFFYDVKTPVVKFRHYLTTYGLADRVFCFSQKDSFCDAFAEEVIVDFGGMAENVSDACSVSIHDFNSGNNPLMDKVLVLGRQAHGQFMSDVPEVYPYTYVVLPCHHSEFQEDDDPEDIHYARGKLVQTLDWFREPQPRARIWFELGGGGGKMHSNQLHFASVSFLKEILTERVLGRDGIVRIEKYDKSIMDIRFNKGEPIFGGFEVEEGKSCFELVINWLKK